MEIILSKHIKTLTGFLNKKKHGYFIRRTPSGKFITVRAKGRISPRGHLSTILDIACMTEDGIFVSEINLPGWELNRALDEAGYDVSSLDYEPEQTYHAEDIFELIKRLGL
jgi:hypothetical protein